MQGAATLDPLLCLSEVKAIQSDNFFLQFESIVKFGD
jgi:hypothetical protein